ncbi:Protein CapL [Nitrospira sp. ND1]|jgi:UDP-N-acetyl-D-glucosamine/UDP-N-acetyl-D-galactosamine dehydrogenase|nr:Protein CapL [Nitrospira sp. ND1]
MGDILPFFFYDIGDVAAMTDEGSDMAKKMQRQIAVVGLGYVGLPIAVAFGKSAPVIGFDINKAKVDELRKGIDRTGEVSSKDLKASRVRYTSEPSDLKTADFIIVAVPTPINEALQPDLTALKKASELIGSNLAPGAIVVYESTVYPGATEEDCLPILEKASGMKSGIDFKIGYSPERINPGDKEHTLERIIKVVSAQDEESLEIVAKTYGMVVKAGIHRASSIKVAEAAKVIENTQRDLNIALMNELALIFHRLGIDTRSVLEAAGTKWNFLKFSPGLVGGHCIGVDPYYLTAKAESVGYHPEVILAGRRINNSMGKYVAEQTVKLLSQVERPVSDLRVGVLGLTFKENVPDLRNSRVPDIVNELREYGIQVVVHDPLAEPEEAVGEYGLRLSPWDQLKQLDGIVLAVAHREYMQMSVSELLKPLRKQRNNVVVDVKSVLNPDSLPGSVKYWRL